MIYRVNHTNLPTEGSMRHFSARLGFIEQLGQIFPDSSFEVLLEYISQSVDWDDIL